MPKSTMIAEEFDQLHGSDAVKWLKDNVTACEGERVRAAHNQSRSSSGCCCKGHDRPESRPERAYQPLGRPPEAPAAC